MAGELLNWFVDASTPEASQVPPTDSCVSTKPSFCSGIWASVTALSASSSSISLTMLEFNFDLSTSLQSQLQRLAFNLDH